MLVDDHNLVRTGVKRLLEDYDDIQIIAEAASGEEAIRLIHEHQPDIVLMDVSMPGMGGLQATRKLLHIKDDLKIIVLTMHDEDLYPQRLLKAGAKGYITKGANIKEMVHAIRQVKAGKHYISPEIAQRLAVATTTSSFDEASPFETLSERELQVMMMLIEGYKLNVISEKLCLSPKTISTYRYRLYNKLGVETDIDLARLAMCYGVIEGTDLS